MDTLTKIAASGMYSSISGQARLVSMAILALMLFIYIIVVSIIINHSVDGWTKFFSVIMLLLYLIATPLYYAYFRKKYANGNLKNIFHLTMILLPLLILITSSVSYNDEKLTSEEKANAKTCLNASIALVCISLIYYSIMSGMYFYKKDMNIFSLAVGDNFY